MVSFCDEERVESLHPYSLSLLESFFLKNIQRPGLFLLIEGPPPGSVDQLEHVGHLLVLLERIAAPISLCLSVRRIYVHERVRPVVSFGAVGPGQALNVGAGEPLPSC